MFFFIIWLGRIKIEKFYIRFYTPKAPICRQARVRGDFEYWKMKFLFKTILPGRQRSRGCVRGVVMVNIFLRLWRGDIGLEKKEKINLSVISWIIVFPRTLAVLNLKDFACCALEDILWGSVVQRPSEWLDWGFNEHKKEGVMDPITRFSPADVTPFPFWQELASSEYLGPGVVSKLNV